MTSFLTRGAVVIAVLVLVGLGFAKVLPTRGDTVRADDSLSIEGLTGKALGIELGLEPTTWADVKGTCEAFAEYDERNGFCMDSVVSNKTEAALLGRQINGYLLTDQEREYIELSFRLNVMMDSGDATEVEIRDLSNQLWEMKKALR